LKDESEFLKDKRMRRCLSCNREYTKEYRHSVNGQIARIYSSQKMIAKKENVKVKYSLEEFMKWVSEQSEFFRIYRLWIINLSPNDKPCIIRLNSGDFELENLKVVTWKQTFFHKKLKQSKPIEHVDDNDNVVSVYSSIRDAAKILGVTRGAVMNSLRTSQKCQGHYFRYKDSTFYNSTENKVVINDVVSQ